MSELTAVQFSHDGDRFDFGDAHVQPLYRQLLADYLATKTYTNPIIWLSRPQGIGLALLFNYQLRV